MAPAALADEVGVDARAGLDEQQVGELVSKWWATAAGEVEEALAVLQPGPTGALPQSRESGVQAGTLGENEKQSTGALIHLAIFIVQSGTLLMHLDGDVAELGAGDLVYIPRGTRHTFATPPDNGARFVTVHTPGGFERFHAAAIDAERLRGAPVPRADLMDLAAGFDWQLAGPPLLPTGVLMASPA